jgi:hypothetical protein
LIRQTNVSIDAVNLDKNTQPSPLEDPLEKLTIGDCAPDFSLPNHQGEMVQLSEMLQDHPLLLVFNIGFA